jgi:hypothetical protein
MRQPDLFRAPKGPWNAERIIGPRAPLKPKYIWAIRQQLETPRRVTEGAERVAGELPQRRRQWRRCRPAGRRSSGSPAPSAPAVFILAHAREDGDDGPEPAPGPATGDSGGPV